MIEIRDGWCSGSLPDDTGREWPVVQHRQASARGPVINLPNLILHTTETSGYVEELRFPSQWQCGDGKIGQHIREGMAGDAVNNWDNVAMQIEMVGRSQVARWLPEATTLGPTVALVAWLHRTQRIRTGLQRPEDWPVVVDRLPAAVPTYYRRQAGMWPQKAGVYGHLEIPDNAHWDPGGFDYPTFFRRVAAAIDVQEGDDMATAQDIIAGSAAGREADLGDPPPSDKSPIWRWAYNESMRRREGDAKASKLPAPGEPAPHEHNLEGKAV